jgi:DNA-binding HxlR family transcriptional regulator
MSSRPYGQYCGVARALELVGERWALLIVRDLTTGPKRFSDLQRGLPKIPSNVLSGRLKDLEQAGVVERRVLPRPSRSVVYDLTGYGRGLECIVLDLAMWGARALGDPRPGEIVHPASLLVGLRAAYRPDAARGVHASIQLRVDDAVVHLRIDDGALALGEGELPGADLAIDTDTTLRAVMSGELSPSEAVESGVIRLTGDPKLLDRFVQAFSLPAPETTTP